VSPGGEYASEPFFWALPDPMTIGRTYPVTQKYTHAYEYVNAHPLMYPNHCPRCELQAQYPNQFDSKGNIYPAVPASPTGRNPSPPPQPKPFFSSTYDLGDPVPLDIQPEYKEEAPEFGAGRGMYKVEKLGWDWKNDPDIEKGYYEPCEYGEANLIGSKTDLEENGHLPCIDLDLPAHLEPSTKPDHYHLYINKVVAWDKYVKLLEALHECGLINEGFKEMSIRRGQSYVRRPGVFKQPGEGDS
jgi:hypothetical protein